MGGPKFLKDEVNSEPELHQLMMDDIEALEEGIKILKHEFQCGERGVVDFLYVDSGNRLGIIEVKKETDEDIIFQGLRYYDWILKNRFAVANMFPNEKINPKEEPRLTLVAKSFSDDIRSLTNHFIPNVELFEYAVLKKENVRGLYFHSVSPPKLEEIPKEPTKRQDLIDYITDERLRKLFKEKLKEVKDLHPEIKENVTKGYIGFMYKGRIVAFLTPFRKVFDISTVNLDDNNHVINYPNITIIKGNEDYSGQIKIMKEAIRKLDEKK